MSDQLSKRAHAPLHVMKFGGTSVGDAAAIRKVAEIVGDARDSRLVVVVSAMAGVTNKLIEAAKLAAADNRTAVQAIFDELRERHRVALGGLIDSVAVRRRVDQDIECVLQEGERLCEGAARSRALTPPAHDAISSLGERMSAPLVAAALAQCGVATEAIEATKLIQTDACHGSANPHLEATSQRCQEQLDPLLRAGIVPVVTGFIAATADGVLTTLGRGGSDYSATILAAALGADAATIWTDVDGMMTADPQFVPDAATIVKISYREAAELAQFGAKVLHPKTLAPVTMCGIPLWVRNTFAPHRGGTRIVAVANSIEGEVKGVAALADAVLVPLRGAEITSVPHVLGRVYSAAANAGAHVLVIAQSPAHNGVSLAVAASVAEQAVDSLRREFAEDLAKKRLEQIHLDHAIAIVTAVGNNLRSSNPAGRICAALGREGVNIIAIARGPSGGNVSAIVEKQDMRAALEAVHREFQLGRVDSQTLSDVTESATENGTEKATDGVTIRPVAWQYEPALGSANAD
jgi:aspartate kinase